MFMIIAYDIKDPRRLLKVAKIMEDYGVRVQLSIFEADLPDKTFRAMRARVEKVIDPEQDGVKYFPLCEECLKKMFFHGKNADGFQNIEVLIV